MKAAVLDQSDFSLHIEEVLIPELKAGQVLIKIKAASLNHHDLWPMKEKIRLANFKIIPGADTVEVMWWRLLSMQKNHG